jgi:hypothetical protein
VLFRIYAYIVELTGLQCPVMSAGPRFVIPLEIHINTNTFEQIRVSLGGWSQIQAAHEAFRPGVCRYSDELGPIHSR